MAMDLDANIAGGSASTSSYAQFAHALSQCRGQASTTLLDTNDGLALLFADACHERALLADEETEATGMGSHGLNGTLLRQIQADSQDVVGFLEGYEEDENDSVAWRLEEQTWRLIHLLHLERAQNTHSDKELQRPQNVYQTPFTAVQELMENDPALSELKIVRDWLSWNLACLHPVEVRKGYWPFTKNRIRSDRRSSSTKPTAKGHSFGASMLGQRGAAGKGVKSLDPDSISREASTLELEDAAYEKALNRTLFEYARGGQLEDAIDLARQSDRHWRAASLRGANMYWRSGLSNDMEELSSAIGNRNRTLWKAVCRSACQKPSMDEYERALYGALSGDLKSVLSVSPTWESQLWAYVNNKLEARIDQNLDNSGSWWSQEASSTFGSAKDLGSVQLSEFPLPSGQGPRLDQETDSPLAVQLREVFVKLAQTEQHGIHLQANHPFRIVQRAVILSEVPALLTHIESLLPSIKVTVSHLQYARLVRFFAHLILYLRLLRWDKMPNDVVCNSILKTYVDILETAGEDELVALYASSLETESATESYAHYLKTMDINETLETKQGALLRAQEHDLDVAAVAITAVSMIFDEVFPSLMPTLTIPKTPLAELSTDLTPSEERLIRAIEWLYIHDSTHVDAIAHVNTLMRLFLNNGRLNAARTLLYDIPANVVEKVGLLEEEGDPDLQGLEFMHWRGFFDALGQHLRFVEVWSKRPPEK